MLKRSPWTPRLAAVPGLAHEQLSFALAEDILAGVLSPGDRLPAHRELALDLSVSVGTVTRAYAILQRRGLVKTEHGRATFVANVAHREPDLFDLSVNVPPPLLTTRMLSEMLSRVGAELDGGLFSGYTPPQGLREHRLLLTRHLSETRGLDVAPENVLITAGAQHAVFVALAATGAGPIALQRTNFAGAITAARRLGRRLVPLDGDAQGITPAALRDALEGSDPPGVLYVVPTLHNPTGATMGEDRRREIAAIAASSGLTVIEDDVYAVLHPGEFQAFAQLLPERAMHIGSFAKSLSPGLRIGFLTVPNAYLPGALEWLEATQAMSHPVSSLLMEHCLTEDLARSISLSIRREGERRQAIAREELGEWLGTPEPYGLHAWLPMPTAIAGAFAAAARRQGILVADPRAFLVDETEELGGVRLCLGGLAEADVRPVLRTCAEIIRSMGPEAEQGRGNAL